MANRLAKENSPYLLQHAHNPVDWYPWGEEAFDRAKAENKPVLVSIGYAACHWCHVMERESFEKEEVAAVMNENFVNIKVDREERPDVDHLYMDAVQAIAGNGGWPLNVFLTPEGKPFYGGTYFPPKRAYNRASWTEVLLAVSQSFRERRDEINQQAENLTNHLASSNSFGLSVSETTFNAKQIDEAFANIMKNADKEWGGFGRAPKFPQTFIINFLLAYGHLSQNHDALNQALLSLDKMMQGGIYDHVGGGFARYSTDTEWLVPHFEKMLYDNALLVSSYADAYALTKNEAYRQVIDETLAFVERELMHKEGGFYSALDADSEGEEGKFYVWDDEEVKTVLGNEAGIFCDYFDIKPGGNWEGKSVPWVKVPMVEFAKNYGLKVELLVQLISDGKQKLLQERSKRIRPLLDDKILLNWNALMNLAYSKAFAVTGNEHYLTVAEQNMRFLLSAFGDFNDLHHSWKDGQAKHPPFLDDYSFLIAALIELAQVSANFSYLDKAAQLTEVVLKKYAGADSPLFFYTAEDQRDILLRKKEVYDGATPSGNSVMAYNLYRLSILLDKPDWRQLAEKAVMAMTDVTTKYPTSFGMWLALLYESIKGTSEIAVVGVNFASLSLQIQKTFIPHKLLMAAPNADPYYPLLTGREVGGKTLIFLCKNYACLQPTITLNEALALLSTK
ncbi:thioredoxin domain-containing protein [Flavisolibacter ginsenosidimutans]|uniref:Thioredoxin domain-containing protein n=1 Tax=Flavisolibacter ginsenosidimutans TaxID=661481 RepID=A0A5B8UM69_9BACT|nr:thioredoxin domain-containing protein [Flavisolibacter ginsenosidimutans]QEC57754.1 thioredoxin domain-containing protein [Flavisolibacter ginsenosidimutans]